jgi:uncharacterized protein YPO0396
MKATRQQIKKSLVAHAVQQATNQQVSDVREAYYKAAEGLAALVEALGEMADEQPEMVAELKHAQRAMEELDASQLGAVV